MSKKKKKQKTPTKYDLSQMRNHGRYFARYVEDFCTATCVWHIYLQLYDGRLEKAQRSQNKPAKTQQNKNESQNEPANFTAKQKMSVVRNLKNEGTVVHHKFV